MSCRPNGTEYETEQVVTAEVLSAENLSEVTIDGEPVGMMILLHIYVTGETYHFAIRELTAQELLIIQQAKTNTDMELALTEVYEMLLGLMF